ncbi:hypothetical protein GWK47_053546 [Chionoecetes opilio]|uniref:Uncharacterized protein n=1 Tax=Chionoecetes opilio TaxID=41210 RepID=A0A8J5CR68_CHIOP|nr:hypothetical protein GWK47_053546 [Chionoecetes opilio]
MPSVPTKGGNLNSTHWTLDALPKRGVCLLVLVVVMAVCADAGSIPERPCINFCPVDRFGKSPRPVPLSSECPENIGAKFGGPVEREEEQLFGLAADLPWPWIRTRAADSPRFNSYRVVDTRPTLQPLFPVPPHAHPVASPAANFGEEAGTKPKEAGKKASPGGMLRSA